MFMSTLNREAFNQHMKKIMQEIQVFLASFLGQNRHHLVISNAKNNPTNFYTMLIQRNYIQISEKEGSSIKKMECSGDDPVFTINGQTSNDPDLPKKFQGKLHRIIKDVLAKRADLLSG